MSNTLREQRETLEHIILAPNAVFADASKGRERDEPPCPVRTCFRRDIDRVVHSKSFRRLKHKTQVFLSPEGDHYRTRMTHTIEVTRIARTVAAALRLNEDLAEAIAWGHDLGHTPFGHAGERALRSIIGSFEHNEQSLRVVDKLEKNGQGLNLTFEVRDGIVNHTGAVIPVTMEGQIVRIADRVAYICHDTDDAIRAGVLGKTDIPPEIIAAVGEGYSERINTITLDLINHSAETGEIGFSPDMYFVMEGFRDFMFDAVYTNPTAKGEESKIQGILTQLFDYYLKSPHELPEDYSRIIELDGAERAVTDYISGMSDRYAVAAYERIYIPRFWGLSRI
ncbi:MAG: deoxyguanosinetriphosphate triphosphohydrolase [Oscillospiraceae bacterium]|jgi:dGTPase|nr:deoxyguanosinetriphosphate triphosphohydrolase [Oscillospiraceae bacterium]